MSPAAAAPCSPGAPAGALHTGHGLAPARGDGLSAAEVQRVDHYRLQLFNALQAQDRQALQAAKQAVLDQAYRHGAPVALRRALRELSWHMAGLLLPRQLR
jgi:hypothetical protein